MKLVAPPMEVSLEDGFSKDFLGRKAYGQALCNVISRSQDELLVMFLRSWSDLLRSVWRLIQIVWLLLIRIDLRFPLFLL